MALNFELKKNGFPINIGGVEFFFETSTEKLKEFFVRQELYEAEFEKLQVEFTTLTGISELDEEIPEEYAKMKVEIDKMLDLTKRTTRADYDALLGEGAFDKIYEAFHDLDKLKEVFYDIEDAVAEAIVKDSEKRADKFNAKRAEVLKKKALKRKKNKK